MLDQLTDDSYLNRVNKSIERFMSIHDEYGVYSEEYLWRRWLWS
jgi:hypothetical protein